MKAKTIWTLGVTGVLVCLVAVLIIDQPASETDSRAAQPELGWNESSGEPTPDLAQTGPTESSPGSALAALTSLRPSARSTNTGNLAASKTSPPAPEQPASLDPAAREQLGRMALSHVGADPVADEIWVWLINDAELSPEVRADLIEDLNENGFSDGDGSVATIEDLPVIENRLLLIEENAPFALDDTNAAAFAEAYNDLAEMWWRLNGL